MTDENKILTLRDNAKNELLAIKTIEDGLDYDSKLKAIKAWAKAKKMDAELMMIINEQSIRTERTLGQLYKQGQENGEIAKQGDFGSLKNTVNTPEEFTSEPKTLAEIGISPKQASNFKKLAEIPDEQFEEIIAERKENVDTAIKELTTSSIVKELKEKESPIEVRDLMDVRVQEIIAEVNGMKTLYRMKIKQGIK